VANRGLKRREFLRVGLAGAGSAALAAGAPVRARAQADRPFAGTSLNVITFRYTYTEATRTQLADFEKLTGIKVRYDVFAEAEESQKVAVELAGGTGAYHVVHISGAGTPQAAEPGWLMPLDEYLRDPKRTKPGEMDVEDFVKGPWDAGKWKGKQYGIPVFVGTQLFYFRKDIVGDRPPTTFDELLAKAKQVHNNPVPGFAARGARGKDAAGWPFPQFMWGFGGKFFRNYPTDMHPVLDSPENLKAAAFWVELLGKHGIPNAASANFDEVLLALSEGKSAMAIEGAPLAARLFDPKQSKVADKLDMAMVPRGPAGRFPPFSGHTWAIPSAARHHEAAWEFIKWSVSREVQLKGALTTNHIAVTRKSVWNDPQFKAKYGYGGGSKFVDLFLQSAQEGRPDYRPPIPEWPQLGDRLSIAVNEALTGQKSVQQAMQDCQKDMFELFLKAGYYKS
jgi:ABC-type glycerol-3-phosphate transport system substrate-binding protein